MNDWKQYLADLIGEKVKASPDAEAAERLPVHVGSAYAVFKARVLEQPVRFLVAKDNTRSVLPDVLRDHAAAKSNLGGEIVLVLSQAPAYLIKRLIRERIPFVVSGKQAYLPRHVVSLRTPPPEGVSMADGDELLSPRAQSLLLYHIEKQSLSGRSQADVARLLEWTPMTVSRCVREFQRKDLCHAASDGRLSVLSFDGNRDLWERAVPRLSSPVVARRFARITGRKALASLCKAGVSALSHYTMIGDDPVPSWAVHHRLARDAVRDKALEFLPYREEGCAVLEFWRYDPVPLAEEDIADRLSLYLSLKGSPDERIESALGELLEGVRW
jgi:hypothetical protein